MVSGQKVQGLEHRVEAGSQMGLGFSTIKPHDARQDISSHWGSVFSSVLEDISVQPTSQGTWTSEKIMDVNELGHKASNERSHIHIPIGTHTEHANFLF